MKAYATTTELATYLDAAAPADAERLLMRASELLDSNDSPITVTFEVDDTDKLPTDADIAAAMSSAVCAQVEFWLETSEAHDIDGLASSEVHVGSYTGVRPPVVAPRALRFLEAAGLTG